MHELTLDVFAHHAQPPVGTTFVFRTQDQQDAFTDVTEPIVQSVVH